MEIMTGHPLHEKWEAAGSTIRTKRTAEGGGFFVADCWRSLGNEPEFAFDGNIADEVAERIVKLHNAEIEAQG